MHATGFVYIVFINNLSLRMKSKRHAKAFKCLFFGNLRALAFF